MMFRRSLATAALLMLIGALPLPAYAYVTPEEVLDDEDFSTRFFEPPPSKREIQNSAAKNEEESARRRQEALEEAQRESGSLEEEPVHEAAPEPEEVKPVIEENEDDVELEEPALTTQELRDQRLLERIHAQRNNTTTIFKPDETLHSGAPLIDTGPATVLVFLAVAAAVAETWRRVRKLNKD